MKKPQHRSLHRWMLVGLRGLLAIAGKSARADEARADLRAQTLLPQL